MAPSTWPELKIRVTFRYLECKECLNDTNAMEDWINYRLSVDDMNDVNAEAIPGDELI